jgi:hypothetical protein
MGNQAVQRLLKSGNLQSKLKIGQPNDKYEQEADRVADRMIRIRIPDIDMEDSRASNKFKRSENTVTSKRVKKTKSTTG